MTLLSGWASLQTLSYNTSPVTGIYDTADPNIGLIDTEVQNFSLYVPRQMVNPLTRSRAVVIGRSTLMETFGKVEVLQAGSPPSEGGLTTDTGPFAPSQVLVFTDLHPVGGILIHEWGHACDFQFEYTYGLGVHRTDQPDIQALWTRTMGLSNFVPGNPYGWSNVKEYWAECFRYHWGGSEYGGNTIVNADAEFRFLISGSLTGPDDSFTVEMHTIINTLVPPPVPLPLFNS